MRFARFASVVALLVSLAAAARDVTGAYDCAGSCVKGQGSGAPAGAPPALVHVPHLQINVSLVTGTSAAAPLFRMDLAIPAKNFTEVEYGALVGNVMRVATFSTMGVADLPAIEEYVFDFEATPLTANKVVRHLQDEGLLFVCNFRCVRQE